MAKLQDSVDAFGGREAVEDALLSSSSSDDALLRDGLIWFNPAPIAVASIAQVHRGTWRNNELETTENY